MNLFKDSLIVVSEELINGLVKLILPLEGNYNLFNHIFTLSKSHYNLLLILLLTAKEPYNIK